MLLSVERLKRYGVSFNTVTVLNDMNVQYPREVYQSLKYVGDGLIQFIPIIKRTCENNISITHEKFAEFYIQIFDEWIANDIGENSGVIEHNGDVYTCDHYVYPEYKLDNIMNRDISQIMVSQKNIRPGKTETLPVYCKKCDYLFACNGGCPRHRTIESPDGEIGLNYLCPAYKKIFGHMSPYLDLMKKLLCKRRK